MLRPFPTHQYFRLWLAGAFTFALGALAHADDAGALSAFRGEILPLLKGKCFDCHADGEKKGGVSFDGFASDEALLADQDLWYRALKNVRDGLMPPPDKEQPNAAERNSLALFIKRDVFHLNAAAPDPGRVTLRRLNRTEYRNTIQDLLNVEFRTDEEFPADDSGHGFDTIGEVLNISPMLMEKYLAAAKTVVSKAVPLQGKTMPEFTIKGESFFREEPHEPLAMLSYNQAAATTAVTHVKHDGHYTVNFKLSGHEDFVEGEPDGNRCKVIFKLDGTDIAERELSTMAGREFGYDVPAAWNAGEHRLTVEVQPLTPNEKQARKLRLRIDSVVVAGPHEPEHWIKPANYDRWFPQTIPTEPAAKLALAQELLGKFATRAFRRPADEATAVRLAKLAESVYTQPDKNFESGVGRAMEAVLASPRFIFREEPVESEANAGFPFIDEYALASRLSYFLWSTMPDEELLRLAGEKKLRAQLGEQFQRLFKHERSQAFVRNFVGQWLEARDIEGVPIDVRFVLQREQPPDPELEEARKRYFELRRKDTASLTPEERDEIEKGRAIFRKRFDKFKNQEFRGDMRRDMRRETEKYVEYVLRENRPLTELVSSDYTFLNQRLAEHYGIPDVQGEEIRRVTLPPDSQRGGLLTQGTVLAVTSNPTRTSPVKRGLFILDNILGSPPPPPPANVPPLEDFSAGKGTEGTLRENLAKHRADAQCASCHNRMDPIGLALENFNAMGKWRAFERGKPIESQGQLSATEQFSSARELKHILVSNHRESFERCVTQKLLTYALGRGLDFHDETTVDILLQRLHQSEGRAGSLLQAIVESDAFTKRRPASAEKPKTAQN
jgi:hypothetical protein